MWENHAGLIKLWVNEDAVKKLVIIVCVDKTVGWNVELLLPYIP